MAATPKHAARVLGLSLDATIQDIRRVRRKMALRYHPDRCADKEQATRHMARINAAADKLSAHIQKRPGSDTSGKSPRPDNFSARKQSRYSSARSGKTKSQSRSRTQEQDVHAKEKTDEGNEPRVRTAYSPALLRRPTPAFWIRSGQIRLGQRLMWAF